MWCGVVCVWCVCVCVCECVCVCVYACVRVCVCFKMSPIPTVHVVLSLPAATPNAPVRMNCNSSKIKYKQTMVVKKHSTFKALLYRTGLVM